MEKNRHPFLSDVQEIRRRARSHIEQGAITPSYGCDPQKAIRILNEALATELVCVLRYKHHYFTAEGLQASAVADEFKEHAAEEQEHADRIAMRIRQLGGNPEMSPDGLLTRSHSEYVEGLDLLDMIRENLIAERIAIESYREMIQFFGSSDPTSRRMLEEILATEEEHAEEMADLLTTYDSKKSVSPAA